MYGDQYEDLEGTELAAEWSLSSLQKFGQEFLKKLKGKKMPNKLLQKVSSNIDTVTFRSNCNEVKKQSHVSLGCLPVYWKGRVRASPVAC